MQSDYERDIWQKRSLIRRHFSRYDAAQISREEFDARLQREGIKLTRQYKAVMRSKAGYIKFNQVVQALSMEDDAAVVRASEGRSESASCESQVLNQILHWKQCTPGADPEGPSPLNQHTISVPYGRQRKCSSQEIRTVKDALRAYEKGLLNIRELREMLMEEFGVRFNNAQNKILNRCARESTVTLQELWMAFADTRETQKVGNFTPRDAQDAIRRPIRGVDNHLNVHRWRTSADVPHRHAARGERDEYIDHNRGAGDILTWNNTKADVCEVIHPAKGLVACEEAKNLYSHHHHADRKANTIMADPPEYNERRSCQRRDRSRNTQNFGGRKDMLHWDGRPINQPRQVFNFEESQNASPDKRVQRETEGAERMYPRLPTPFGTDSDVVVSETQVSPDNVLTSRYRMLSARSTNLY